MTRPGISARSTPRAPGCHFCCRPRSRATGRSPSRCASRPTSAFITRPGAEPRLETRALLLHRVGIAANRLAEGIDALGRLRGPSSIRADEPRDGAGENVPSWRPFQLGFVMLNAAGLVDETHSDRETLDLLLFPTGGGKTEAYSWRDRGLHRREWGGW